MMGMTVCCGLSAVDLDVQGRRRYVQPRCLFQHESMEFEEHARLNKLVCRCELALTYQFY